MNILPMYTKGILQSFHIRPHRLHWLGDAGDMITGYIMHMAVRTRCPADNDEPQPVDVTI